VVAVANEEEEEVGELEEEVITITIEFTYDDI
jgi:hypothetical protein